MTPLRQRFLEDMQIRNYSPKTIKTTISHVAAFAAFCGKSPEHLGPEDIRRWQIHLISRKLKLVQVQSGRVCVEILLPRDAATRVERRDDPLRQAA